MKRLLLITVLISFFYLGALGQRKTWLGIEASITSDQYNTTDPGNEMRKIPILGALGGVVVRQEISARFFLETAILFKNYDEGIGFKKEPGYSTSTGFNAWVLPLRAGMKFLICRRKPIYLVPVAGYAFGLNADYNYGAGGGSGTTITNTDIVQYDYTSSYKSQTFHLLQAGAAIQFRFFRKASIQVSGNYYAGLTRIMEQDVSYSINNGAPQNALIRGNGSFWNIGVGMQYPISSLWTK